MWYSILVAPRAVPRDADAQGVTGEIASMSSIDYGPPSAPGDLPAPGPAPSAPRAPAPAPAPAYGPYPRTSSSPPSPSRPALEPVLDSACTLPAPAPAAAPAVASGSTELTPAPLVPAAAAAGAPTRARHQPLAAVSGSENASLAARAGQEALGAGSPVEQRVASVVVRGEHGRFGPGNEAGRLRKRCAGPSNEARETFLRLGLKAVPVLEKLLSSRSPKVRFMAARLIFERAYGAVPQSIALDAVVRPHHPVDDMTAEELDELVDRLTASQR